MRRLVNLVLVFFMSGCATYLPVPPEYKGPTAYISDSGSSETSSRIQLFYLSAVDGNGIRNSAGATNSANHGRGFSIYPTIVGRQVQARPQKLKLRATHAMGAPIHELAAMVAGTFFSVDGEVEFSPEPDGRYVVKGELKKEGSSVWIEEENGGKVVTEKIVEKR